MTPDRSHYRKTSPTTVIDVYRVLQLFDVADPCLQHAVKKLLAAGKRGAKDTAKDVAEAIESLRRWQEMRAEEAQVELAADEAMRLGGILDEACRQFGNIAHADLPGRVAAMRDAGRTF